MEILYPRCAGLDVHKDMVMARVRCVSEPAVDETRSFATTTGALIELQEWLSSHAVTHVETINPIVRGWGNYYCRSNVRKRFNQLDRWIIQRLWSHRAKRWRNTCWKEYPTRRLRTEFKLVSLVSLIPSLKIAKARS